MTLNGSTHRRLNEIYFWSSAHRASLPRLHYERSRKREWWRFVCWHLINPRLGIVLFAKLHIVVWTLCRKSGASRPTYNFSCCVNAKFLVSRIALFIKLSPRPRASRLSPPISSPPPPYPPLNCLIGVKLRFLLLDSFERTLDSRQNKERAIRIFYSAAW